MAQEQNDSRKFLIKHESCGSMFIIDSKTFLKTTGNYKRRNRLLHCPNCDELLISELDDFDTFTNVLNLYDELGEILGKKGASICELQPNQSIDL